MLIKLVGRIDSSNAFDVERNLNEQIGGNTGELVLDATDLEYISSAGLRVILRLKKANPTAKVINCNSDVYEIFDMTGFTEMMDISKAFRKISVDGCEAIGEGANGIVYRVGPDEIVKVYKSPDSLDDIKNERELARKAFVLGIPTAIPYDVVQVGDLYGSVFELLNAKSFAQLLKEGANADDLAKQSVDILKIIHGTSLKAGELPSKKRESVGWAKYCLPYLPKEIGDKLLVLFSDIPESNSMLHGDFHIKNVMKQGDENLLIDMDTLSMGHPVYEFSQMYLAYLGFSETDKEEIKRFMGIDHETALAFWNSSLKYYFNDKSPEYIKEVETKAAIIAYVRLLRRTLKRNTGKDAVKENCIKRLTELVPVTDSLYY